MSGLDARIIGMALSQDDVFATWQLRGLVLAPGVTRARRRDGRAHRVHRGVYSVGHPPRTMRAWWRAAVLALGPTAILSHRSAGLLWGILTGQSSRVDVTTPGGSHRRQAGIARHRARNLAPQDMTMHDGLPVTSLARTLLDLAAILPSRRLRRAWEAAERLRLLDLVAVEELLERSRGHHGAKRLRKLLEYDPAPGARARSDLEGLFLDCVREAKLPAPVLNTWIAGFEVDAYWPQARLAIELQSYEWHGNRAAFERDHRKLAALKRAGYEAMPLTHRQLTRHWPETLATLDTLLKRTPT